MSEDTDGKPGPKPKVTPPDVLKLFEEREDRAEPLTASEVADALNCSRRTVGRKFEQLLEQGDVDSKKVGGRSRVYWVPIRPGE
ncbi:helix-turn-helix domain-containing protein [Halalkalicoccus tibetensis]|uniref:Helix-turn-helix domain-containing protein n=1 Tax=Halalkalicoccus tibetensis TaxID=175632 RepID=A0ABD5V5M4_9EURY